MRDTSDQTQSTRLFRLRFVIVGLVFLTQIVACSSTGRATMTWQRVEIQADIQPGAEVRNVATIGPVAMIDVGNDNFNNSNEFLVGPWKGGRWSQVTGPPEYWVPRNVLSANGHWLLTAINPGGCPQGIDPAAYEIGYYDANPASDNVDPRWVPIPRPASVLPDDDCNYWIDMITSVGSKVYIWGRNADSRAIVGWSFQLGSTTTEPLPPPPSESEIAGRDFVNSANSSDRLYAGLGPGGEFEFKTSKWLAFARPPGTLSSVVIANGHLAAGNGAHVSILGDDMRWSAPYTAPDIAKDKRLATTLTGCGTSVVFQGGYVNTDLGQHYFDDGTVYNLATNKWTAIPHGGVTWTNAQTISVTDNGSILYIQSVPVRNRKIKAALLQNIPGCRQ